MSLDPPATLTRGRVRTAHLRAFAGLGLGSKGQETTYGPGRDERATSKPAQELPARSARRRPFRDFK